MWILLPWLLLSEIPFPIFSNLVLPVTLLLWFPILTSEACCTFLYSPIPAFRPILNLPAAESRSKYCYQ